MKQAQGALAYPEISYITWLKMFGEGVSKYTYVLKSSLAILIHRSKEVYINEVAVILQNLIGVLENSPIVRKPK